MESLEIENKKLKKLLELQQYEEKQRECKHKFEMKLLKDTHKKELSDLRKSNNILIGENSDLLDRLNVLKKACIMPTQVSVETQTPPDYVQDLVIIDVTVDDDQTNTNAKPNKASQETLIDLSAEFLHKDQTQPNNLSLHEEIMLISTGQNKTLSNVNEIINETLTLNEELLVIENTETLSHVNAPKPQLQSAAKQVNVLIVSDSNGRDMAEVLGGILSNRFKISSSCFPNAKLNTILEHTKQACSKLTEDDFLIVVGGINDALNSEELPNFARLRQISYRCNVIVLETMNIHSSNRIPGDLQRVNSYIDRMNSKLHRASSYTVISVTDLSDHVMRRDGFHFTHKGKEELASRIKQTIYGILNTLKVPQPISVLMTERADSINPASPFPQVSCYERFR